MAFHVDKGQYGTVKLDGLNFAVIAHAPEPTMTVHPANARLALAKATRSHLHAFGIDWDDDSGRNNGHFAPFAWSAS